MKLKTKHQILIFLFSLIAGVTFCQNNSCYSSGIFVKSFLIEKDVCGNFHDFTRLFPPTTIKNQKINELKFKVQSKDLKWSKKEIPFNFCFDLTFKVNKKGLVTNVIYELEEFEITYNLVWSKKVNRLKSREKIIRSSNTKELVEKSIEKYFFNKSDLLIKIEEWIITPNLTNTSPNNVINYQYDELERVIFSSSLNPKLTSKTTYEHPKKSNSKDYYDETYLGESIKEYDERKNLIFIQEINKENKTHSYNEYEYSKSNQFKTTKHLSIDQYGYIFTEVVFQFDYLENGSLSELNFTSDKTLWKMTLIK